MSVAPPKPIFEQIESFVRNIATGFDCDSDAHRYNTFCRCCEAEKLLAELKGEPGCKLGNPCYRKYCLSCFCHGNIQYLSYEQAVVQSGMRVASNCGYVPIDSQAAETDTDKSCPECRGTGGVGDSICACGVCRGSTW